MRISSFIIVFGLSVAIGKYGCGQSARADRLHDLRRSRQAIESIEDGLQDVEDAVEEGQHPHPAAEDLDDLVGQGERVEGRIVMRPGMLVDPDARTVHRVSFKRSQPVYLPEPTELAGR